MTTEGYGKAFAAVTFLSVLVLLSLTVLSDDGSSAEGFDITLSKGLCTDDVTISSPIAVSGLGVSVTLPAPAVPDGSLWRFVGYSEDAAPPYSVTYPSDSLEDIVFEGPAELTAVWTVPITGYVSGCTANPSKTAVAGSSWDLSVITPEGYSVRFSAVSMGTEEIPSDGGVCHVDSVTAPLYYSVVAKPDVHTIVLDTGRGTIDSPSWVLKSVGGKNMYLCQYTVDSGEVAFPEPIPESRFVVFDSWSGGRTSASSAVDGDVTSEAVWKERTFTVETVAGDTHKILKLTVSGSIPDPEPPDGYYFSAWQYTDGDGGRRTFVSNAELTDGMTLEADFVRIPDSVNDIILYPLAFILICLGICIVFRLRR